MDKMINKDTKNDEGENQNNKKDDQSIKKPKVSSKGITKNKNQKID